MSAEATKNKSYPDNINCEEELISIAVNHLTEKPITISLLNEDDSTKGIGTLIYYFWVVVTYVNIYGQTISDTIEFMSTVYDCATAITDFAKEYVVNNHLGVYRSHESGLDRTVTDTGCWTPDTPWNPFCRIATKKSVRRKRYL